MKKLPNYIRGTIVLLRRQNSFLRGSYLEYILVAILFVIIAVVYTNFIAFNINSQLFSGSGDSTAGFLWLNFADHSLNPFLSHTDYVNYPYGANLGGPTFITYAALWLPLRILSFLFGPFAGLNLVMLWGYIGAAIGMYWLLKKLTGNIPAAIFSGFAVAFTPYAMYKSSAHLAYIFSIVFVLITASFVALWVKPSKKRTVFLALSIALAFYTDGYYVLLATVMMIGLVFAGVLHAIIMRFKWADYRIRIKSLLLAFCSFLLLMIPIGYVQITQSNQINGTLSAARDNIANEINIYRSNVIDFILPPVGNPVLNIVDGSLSVTNYRNLRSNSGESTLYIGAILIILTAVGFILIGVWLINKKYSTLILLDKVTLNKYILLGCITFIAIPLYLSFMFSPQIYILGHLIPLPGKFLIDHNIALWRVMSRFFIPLHVLVVVFAAFTLWITLHHSALMARADKYKKHLITTLVLLLLLVTAFEYQTTVNRPSFNINNQPKGYQWLKSQNNIKVIAELPMVDPLDSHSTNYVTSQIYHGKKLVNIKESNDRQITNTLGSIKNPEAIDFAFSRGAQVIITHDIPCEIVAWGAVVFNDMESKMCIYKLERPVSKDLIFTKFGEGFAYSANQKNSDDSAVSIIKAKSTISFVDKSFSKNQSGSVRLAAEITSLKYNDDKGTWTISQNNKIISSGIIVNSHSIIDVKLLAKYDVSFYIKLNDKTLSPGLLVLKNTIATGL